VQTISTTPEIGSWTQSPALADGTYWYGAHAVDNATNCIDGEGDHCGGVGADVNDQRTIVEPIKVVVDSSGEGEGEGEGGDNIAPIAEFTMCRFSGTNVVEFTNESTDEDVGDTLTYVWDFGDGVGSSTQENPIYDYSGSVAGTTSTQMITSQQEEINLILKDTSFFGPLIDSYKFLWKQISNLWQKIFIPKVEAEILWWNEDFDYRKQITFDNSAQTENLTNVPVLISLTSSNFDFSKVKSLGQDIRFIDDDDSTKLDYEIEEWDDGGEQATVWVKVPQIDGSSDTDFIYIYYGDNSAGDEQNSTGVWSNSFSHVIHLNEDSSPVQDSTSNNNDGNVTRADYTASGKFSGAYEFESGNFEKINLGTSGFSRANSTVSAWTRYDGPADYSAKWYGIFSQGSFWCGSRNLFSMKSKDDDFGYKTRYDSYNNCNVHADAISTEPAPIGVWKYVTYSWDNTANEYLIYLDGVEIARDDITNPSTLSTGGIRIGALYFTGSYTWDGLIDEFRISSVTRSPDWIAFEYCNTNQSCMIYGDEEQYGLYATLIADDGTDIDTERKLVDLDTMDPCDSGHIFNSLSATTCNYVGGEWTKRDGFDEASEYDIHRCTGDVATCDEIGDYSVISPEKLCGTNCTFDDITTVENTTYSYYISADTLNNSTGSCTGGFQSLGDLCPLSLTTPACQPQGLEISRTCGTLKLDWTSGDVASYKILRCIENNCTPSETLVEDLAQGSPTYDDDEVIPVNTTNPSSGSYYCYQVVGVDDEGEDSTPSDTVCEYSYCYRGPTYIEE